MLGPVSCDHVKSFNYDGKKARDVGLTCSCHLSNIMLDSNFHESMRHRIPVCFFCFFVFMLVFCFFLLFLLFVLFCFVLLFRGYISVFLRMKGMESVLSLEHQWAWRNLKLYRT